MIVNDHYQQLNPNFVQISCRLLFWVSETESKQQIFRSSSNNDFDLHSNIKTFQFQRSKKGKKPFKTLDFSFGVSFGRNHVRKIFRHFAFMEVEEIIKQKKKNRKRFNDFQFLSTRECQSRAKSRKVSLTSSQDMSHGQLI